MDGMLSQDEINALLSGMSQDTEAQSANVEPSPNDIGVDDGEQLLGAIEKDAIGEVANISMGSSATTLYSLVNRKVSITTPIVSVSKWEDVISDYERPCVFIQIKYTAGLDGRNILILREQDVKVITDLMMGGDGTNIEGELSDMHLSAISEAMNQMMGSSATSLSTMMGMVIDISPPTAELVDMKLPDVIDDYSSFTGGQFVKISFKMQIGDLVDSVILQLYPLDFAKEIVNRFMGEQMADMADHVSDLPYSSPEPEVKRVEEYVPPRPLMNDAMLNGNMSADMQGGGQGANMGIPQGNYNQPDMGYYRNPLQEQAQYQNYAPPHVMGMPASVNYQPAQFQSFAQDLVALTGQENIELIMDVPLEVTVELGRTVKSIADILDFAPGTIVELDKIAGEPIDLLVNGKFVAKGEVVVIEESFGVRVTEIVK